MLPFFSANIFEAIRSWIFGDFVLTKGGGKCCQMFPQKKKEAIQSCIFRRF